MTSELLHWHSSGDFNFSNAFGHTEGACQKSTGAVIRSKQGQKQFHSLTQKEGWGRYTRLEAGRGQKDSLRGGVGCRCGGVSG